MKLQDSITVCLKSSTKEFAKQQNIFKANLLESGFSVNENIWTIRRENNHLFRRNVDFLILIVGEGMPLDIQNDVLMAQKKNIPIVIFENSSRSNLLNSHSGIEIYSSFDSTDDFAAIVKNAISSMKRLYVNRRNQKAHNLNDKSKSIKQLEDELERLKEEKKALENTNVLKEADHLLQTENLEAELKNLEAELEKALADKARGEQIEEKLSTAFESLTDLDNDMKADINRLNCLFYIYIILTLVFFGILGWIWFDAFKNLKGENFEIAKVWIYSAPSFVLVGFIGAFIHQISRAQRQLLYLKKYNRKYKVIKYALKGYYAVENELNKTPDKAQEIFELIIKVKLGQNIDFDAEEKKAKESESQDQSIKEDFAKQIIDAIKSIGGKKE